MRNRPLGLKAYGIPASYPDIWVVKRSESMEKLGISESSMRMMEFRRVPIEAAIETLAGMFHGQWIHWLEEFLGLADRLPNGDMVLSEEHVQHWLDKMTMEYDDLDEEDQEEAADWALRVIVMLDSLGRGKFLDEDRETYFPETGKMSSEKRMHKKELESRAYNPKSNVSDKQDSMLAESSIEGGEGSDGAV